MRKLLLTAACLWVGCCFSFGQTLQFRVVTESTGNTMLFEDNFSFYSIGMQSTGYYDRKATFNRLLKKDTIKNASHQVILLANAVQTMVGVPSFGGWWSDSILMVPIAINPDTDVLQYDATIVLINKNNLQDKQVLKRINKDYYNAIFNLIFKEESTTTLVFGFAPKYGKLKLAIEKIDSLGNTLWSKVYASPRSDAHYFPLYSTATADGGFAVAISEEYFFPPGTPLNPTYPVQHIQVLKLDSLGNKQWLTSISPPDSACLLGGIVEGDSANLFVSWTNPYRDMRGTPNQDSQAIQLTKLNASGNIVWRKNSTLLTNEPRFYNSDITPKKTILDNDGNIVVAGWQYGNIGEMFLYKVTQTGEPLWYKIYRFYDSLNIAPGGEKNIPYDLIQTSDGGYLVAGEFYCPKSNLFPDGIQHGFLWKFDGDGCFEQNPCNIPSAVTPLSIIESLGVRLYPNPATTTLTLQLSTQPSTHTSQLTYSIQNTIGQTLLSAPINDQEMTIDVSQLPKGVYIFTLLGENNVLKNEKLVK